MIHHSKMAGAAGALPTLIRPRMTPLDKSYREFIGSEIDRLIALLDAADTDPDLEDGGDCEPSLGFVEREQGASFQGISYATDDREAEPEHFEDDGTTEPTLGWTAGINQNTSGKTGQGSYLSQEDEPSLGWSSNNGGGWDEMQKRSPDDDREDEHDGAEPSEDAENSLGWSEDERQVHLGMPSDLEQDNDTGIADHDALDVEMQERPGGAWGLRSSITDLQRAAIRDVERRALRIRLPRSGIELKIVSVDGGRVIGCGRLAWRG